ncbi:pyridoxamine 5'-phosphate oxidase [Streptomyces platensis]|uniref:pyridoxamine 5'-phosphate oxidase n=1 Tax=Streptomyces platensis TaxID=58346 RepID=UPI001F388D38|nr:pyridoxamine 5'-phosphate oxidase [Streptomyces platensis]
MGQEGVAAAGSVCPEVIVQALAAHTTMTLAYMDEDGPQACAVLYATGAAEGPEGPEATAGAGEVPGATGDADGTDGADESVASGVSSGAAGGADGRAADGAAGGATGVTGGLEAGAGPALYFVTATTTRHGRALAEPGPGARVAFTAQRDGQEWSGLTGLQGRGRCRPLTGAERAAGWQVYVERFPFVAASDRLRAALERTTLWELRPDWLRLIDNGQGFGHKEEWSRG